MYIFFPLCVPILFPLHTTLCFCLYHHYHYHHHPSLLNQAKLDYVNDEDRTALIISAMAGRVGTCRRLAAFGAALDLRWFPSFASSSPSLPQMILFHSFPFKHLFLPFFLWSSFLLLCFALSWNGVFLRFGGALLGSKTGSLFLACACRDKYGNTALMIAAVNGHPRAVSVCWRAVCSSYLAAPLAQPLSPPLFTFSAHLLASVGCASAWHEYLIVVVSLKPWVAGVRAYHTEEECVLASPVLGHALCMSAASGGRGTPFCARTLT